MAGELTSGLLASLVGGSFVAVTNYLAVRKRTSAETRKLDAEADRARAETTRILLEVTTPWSSIAPAVHPPEGWMLRGSHPGYYDVGVDEIVRRNGQRSGYISSRPYAEGFGTLMQSIRAQKYVGKRIRLGSYVRTAAVTGWAGLWMRIDGRDQETLGFDNMGERPIIGTSDWNWFEIVLDVPAAAELVNFGLLLDGPGQAWMAGASLETVPETVPTTAPASSTGELPTTPINLDFSR